MADQADPMAGPTINDVAISNPANSLLIGLMGVLFSCCFLFFISALIMMWPVTAGEGATKVVQDFRFFGYGPYKWQPDLRFLTLVVLAGAVGSLIHAMTSFGDYVGNRRLSLDWIWWFLLRIPIGMALAAVSYLLLRGGFLGATPSDQQNAYGIAGFAALAGMLSRQAIDKLREVFEIVFTVNKPVERSGELQPAQRWTINPKTIVQETPSPSVTIAGPGLKQGAKALLNGEERKADFTLPNSIKVTLRDSDVERVGPLAIIVTSGSDQASFLLNVTKKQ